MNRPNPALDALLDRPIPVLDHGHVTPIRYMGDDQAIVETARVSTGTTSHDTGLIRYLMRHHHTGPFEACEIAFRVRAPIFVARQWMRHRTASVNEMSGRYSVLATDFYIPAADDVCEQSADNMQGRGASLGQEAAQRGADIIDFDCRLAFFRYHQLLEMGVSRELARTVLPLSTYTEWVWKIDLHNLFHFLRLRLDPHAQYEIRVYAEVILRVVEAWVPVATQAFRDYRLNAVTLSAQQWAAVRRMLPDGAELAAGGMGKREEDELRAVLAAQAPAGADSGGGAL